MLLNFDIKSLSFDDSWQDSFTSRLEEILRGWSVEINALTHATGMSKQEIVDFLDSRGIEHSGSKNSYDAVYALKEWYLKKMRRYLRNGLSQEFEPGCPDEILFIQFCDNYRKVGHRDVKSWGDIDEFRLLQDFEAKCLDDFFPIFRIEPRETGGLLDRVHRCFLFHLRLKKPPKHNECQVRTIISIILCNRYHIFTAEADSQVDTTDYKAHMPDIFMFNPPRSASRLVSASLAKA